MELSKELNKHNKLVEKALERQERMIQKVDRIEHKLMMKEIFNYQKIQDEMEKRKTEEEEKRIQFEHRKQKLTQLIKHQQKAKQIA